MNEQLQQALAHILNRTVEGIDASTQFLSAQLPDVIQQLLLWKFIHHLALAVVPMLVLAAAVYAAYRLTKIVQADPFEAAVRKVDTYREQYSRARSGSAEEAAARAAHMTAQVELAGLTDRTAVYVTAGVAVTVLVVVSAITSAVLVNLTWLQILVAPKLYLIEYAATLVK